MLNDPQAPLHSELYNNPEVGNTMTGDNAQIAAMKNKGTVLMLDNRLQEARGLYSEIVNMNPEDVNAWYMLSTINGKLGNLDDAESCSRRVLDLQPDHSDAYVNLGHVYTRRGNYREALTHYKTAVDFKPDSPVAFFNMGNIFNEQGKQDEAIECYRQAIQLSPLYAEAHNNLGTIYLALYKLDEAVSCYVKALEINPLFVIALNNLAKTCQSVAEFESYIKFYRQAVAQVPDPAEARKGFIKALERLPVPGYSSWLNEELHKCILLDDIDYKPLALVTARLLIDKYSLREPAILAESQIQGILERIAVDELFLLFIQKIVNIDATLEVLLTRLRRSLLFKANNITDISQQEMCVLSALAFQCFNNEHIFALDSEEDVRLAGLKGAIEQHISRGRPPNKDLECMLLVAGMYVNIFTLSCGQLIAGYPITAWSNNFRSYAHHVLRNFFEEQKIKERIESIGTIRDQTTQLVQTQYEHNPYPRWLSLTNKKLEKNTKDFLKALFPHFSPPSFLDGPIKVLIAGCGTGKQAIQAALSYSDAEILAVDISKSSIAYAIRMADKYDIKNIEFKQADILELSRLNTRFHIIECQGVLHHMEDPLKGWRVLSGLLVKDGLMSIGLYSEMARRAVVAARKIIENEKLSPGEKDIRDFRSRVLKHEIGGLFEAFAANYDFYTMSACRDLLFHYKEHRFTLPQIDGILNELKMRFLGFMFADARVLNNYHRQFPEDSNMTNLLVWDRFESRYPDTFTRMYQFFCQKI